MKLSRYIMRPFFLGWQHWASVDNRVKRNFQKIFYRTQIKITPSIQCHCLQSRRLCGTVTCSIISHITFFVFILLSRVDQPNSFIHQIMPWVTATQLFAHVDKSREIYITTAGSSVPVECVERDRERWKRQLSTLVDSEAAPLPANEKENDRTVWGTWEGDLL